MEIELLRKILNMDDKLNYLNLGERKVVEEEFNFILRG